MGIYSGNDNANVISASNSDDTIWGWKGDDTIFAGGGNDSIIGGEGADTIWGGTGIDTAYYGDSTEAVLVTLVSGDGYGGTADGDQLNSIENLIGSAYNDQLIGNDFANVLDGGAGNDTLKGYGGADTLNGGSGIDTATYAFSAEGVVVNLLSDLAGHGDAEGDDLNSIENLTGSSHDDKLWGDDNVNVLKGEDGEDELKGFGGADKLYGGDHADELYGGNGVDVLHGENGDDYLAGGNDNDNLAGGYGADTLVGGAGADTLTGGAGYDVFVFASIAESAYATPDNITDLAPTSMGAGDKIDLSKIDANTGLNGDQQFTWIGNNNEFVDEWGAGQLRFNGGYVEGDVNGDMVADFRIKIDVPGLSMPENAFIL
jgi:Ca2+-binding RTX toxin-like protein